MVRRARAERSLMTRAIVTLRFYEELDDFLPPERRRRSYERPLFLSPTVKAVIEA